ncbi:MAG: RNA polymerase sigma factor [Chitinophagales bacterium]
MFDTATEEKEMLRQLLQGDEQAFEKIYRLYSPRLYGRLLKLLKSVAQTEEILQDVFLKVWEYRASIDPEKSFRAFLFKIAENKAYDFFRKASRDKKLEAELVALSTVNYMALEEFMANDEKSVLLENAISKLPPQRQQVFRLCKLEGKSYRDVSELLGISLSTISDHIVKATKSIRNYLESTDNAVLDADKIR